MLTAGTVRISVCMATRDGGKFIRQQLATILGQLGPGDEVIISDDSSRDDTVEIIRSFHDPRIRLFEGREFFNPIFNFEFALSQAAGEIVVLADQDDIWLDNKVATIRERFADVQARPLLIVMDGIVVDDGDRELHPSIFGKINAGPGVLKNLYDNTYLGCSIAFSRDLLRIALPFPARIPMHDMWLGLLCNIHGRVEFVPVKTLRYRKHAASLTDFRRQFKPLLQIRRRLGLAWCLLTRSIARKRGAAGGGGR